MSEREAPKSKNEPLAYESSRTAAESPAALVIVTIAAAGVGALVPLILGVMLFLIFNFDIGGPGPARPPLTVSWIPAAIFVLLTISAGALGVQRFRQFPRRWFGIGFLIGFGIMSLIEGGCYTLPIS